MYKDTINERNLCRQTVLYLIFAFFIVFSVFVALHLKPGIAPDEDAHFLFSKFYSETWGIPENSAQTIVTGWLTKDTPFVYHWLNGRIINIITSLFPSIQNDQLLTVLRLINVVYATLAMVCLYLTSKELIPNPWLQLLPVFLLANTLMWVFLAGAVSYDNLANLLCLAAILFFVRAYQGIDFQKNALFWIILILLGCLVKITLLPIAGLLVLFWTITGNLQKQITGMKSVRSGIELSLIIISVILIISNLLLYGGNLIKYGSFTPTCMEVMDSTTCSLDPMHVRHENLALPEKLTIAESIRQGYPNPLEYVFYSWIPNMLYRIFGILGHSSYFPSHIIIVFYILFVWYFMLAFKYLGKPTKLISGLAGIFVVYSTLLLVINYRSELVYGFRQIAMQGRYIFPVIGIAYIVIAIILEAVKNKSILWLTTSFTIFLFLISGPIKFLTKSQTIFLDWFK